jgi:hypothetical protein
MQVMTQIQISLGKEDRTKKKKKKERKSVQEI